MFVNISSFGIFTFVKRYILTYHLVDLLIHFGLYLLSDHPSVEEQQEQHEKHGD